MLAIIPARAGSKGLPNKNKKLFCGRPLIEWSIECALNASSVSAILVTSDDPEILAMPYVKHNSDFLIKRPPELSADRSPASGYITHSLSCAVDRRDFDYFCILQPTSPLRLPEDIDSLLSVVIEGNVNSGVTVVDVPHNFSPDSLMSIDGGVAFPSVYTLTESNLRQEKPRVVARNGAAVYVCRSSAFVESGTIFFEEMAFHKMPPIRSVDIDSADDFKIAELIMKDKLKCG